MKCPVDGETLVMTDRSGVEIDYCPQCRGVWLDRGELDKIIERSGAPAASAGGPPPPPQQRHGDQGRYQQPYKKKRRGGFLDDIFDF